ncbi:PEP-CTERM sorting domain-containing protein [Sphingomonas paeninsulae]|uniref:PEP-CTERM sorting domain-containing protein n=2 Tax=Sphingomonas paeninsulae TaxID=2319844 RepID=A0A494TG62_SPHPE|nr:PEP-CTERM sorting domain-containing protein [Sphingomonas paeninsulae]
MKTSSKFACAAILTLAWSMPAYATDFTGNYSTTVNSSGSGLLINTQRLAPDLQFTLNNVGQTVSSDLFKIYTNETDVGADDLVGQAIQVGFTFTSPAFGGVLDGTTVGERSFFGLFQNGVVHWNNGGNAVFDFGNGGQLQVHLNDTSFNFGLGGLGEGIGGSGTVKANFTLNAISSAAPEPATWAFMIFGFGAAGYSLRRRRVSYGQAQAA